MLGGAGATGIRIMIRDRSKQAYSVMLYFSDARAGARVPVLSIPVAVRGSRTRAVRLTETRGSAGASRSRTRTRHRGAGYCFPRKQQQDNETSDLVAF